MKSRSENSDIAITAHQSRPSSIGAHSTMAQLSSKFLGNQPKSLKGVTGPPERAPVRSRLRSVRRNGSRNFLPILESTRFPARARIQEFITGQPAQILYLMASECARQNVTTPSILK